MQRYLLLMAALAFLFATRHATPVYADDAEQQLVSLVNAERQRHGLWALSVSSTLATAARAYAFAMAQGRFFGHQGADGSTFVSRDLAAGYRTATYLGEDLAAGQPTPSEALAALLNSPEHRNILLSTSAVEIGAGHAYVPGSPMEHYWVLELGNCPEAVRPSISLSSRGGARSDLAAAQPAGQVPAPAARPPAEPVATSASLAAQPEPPSSLAPSSDFEVLGRPLSGVILDPVVPGQYVQYFQRAVLEWHPENPPGERIQRRLLGSILFPGSAPPADASDPPPGPYGYFPLSIDGVPTGLGHFVADYTRSGQPIYFKDFFDHHGGVRAFGYPMDEPRVWNGLWTQRFQAAVLQYHPEYDRDGVIPGTDLPWRYFRVQLRLLGEQYLLENHLAVDALSSKE